MMSSHSFDVAFFSSSEHLKSFMFVNQRQADMLSDPSRMIKDSGLSPGVRAGASDRLFVAEKVYVRRANVWLKKTRIFPVIQEYLVTQKQILLDHANSTAIDRQLSLHYAFLCRNDSVQVCQKQLDRMVREHMEQMELPIGYEEDPTSPAHQGLKRSPSVDTIGGEAGGQPPKHARKSSLAMIYDDAAAAEVTPSIGVQGKNLPDELSTHVQVEIEIPQHKLQALYMLRILRLRELRARILSVLNYFRSMQKLLVTDETLYTAEVRHSGSAGSTSTGSFRPPSHHASSNASHMYSAEEVLKRAGTARELEDRADEWSFSSTQGAIGAEHIHVRDARKKVRIIYDAALTDLKQLETELLSLASIYIDRHQYAGMGMKGSVDGEIAAYQSMLQSLDGSIGGMNLPGAGPAKYLSRNKDAAAHVAEDETNFYPDPLILTSSSTHAKFEDSADRWSVLLDLLERESTFLQAKRSLMDVYFEAYTHTIDKTHLRGLALKMINLMAYRPHFDLDRSVSSFATIYQVETSVLKAQTGLFREVMYAQVEEELLHGLSVGSNPISGGNAPPTGGISSSTASAHATFDWSLFAHEYSTNPMDITGQLSQMRVTPALPSVLQRPHTLFEVHESFDILDSLSTLFDQTVENVLSTLPGPKKSVLHIYTLSVRQKVVDNILHCFRSHIHEDAVFPTSQHSTTLEFFATSPFFSSAAYAVAKLRANFQLQREAMTGANRRQKVLDEEGNVTDGNELQLYFNYAEVLHVRQHLLSVMYESIIMTRLYFSQAERLGVEAPRTMLDMHSATFAQMQPAATKSVFSSLTTSSFLLSSGSGEVGSFAIAEVFSFLPKDLFRKLQDLEKLEVLTDGRVLQHLRTLLEVQRMQSCILETTLTVHSVLASASPDDLPLIAGGKSSSLDPLHLNKPAPALDNLQLLLDGVSPGVRRFFREPSQRGSGSGNGSAPSSTSSASGARGESQPFAKMIREIHQQAEGGAGGKGKPGERGKSRIKGAVASGSGPTLRTFARSRVEQRGCLTAETFVDIYALKQHARSQLESFLSTPLPSSSLLPSAGKHPSQQAVKGKPLLGANGILPPAKQMTNGATMASEAVIRRYVWEVLTALAPEIYVVEVRDIGSRFTEMHEGPFGSFSPFVSIKFKLSGPDGYLDHLLANQGSHASTPTGADAKDKSASKSNEAVLSPAASLPAAASAESVILPPPPAPTPSVVQPPVQLADGSMLQPVALRWGGGAPAEPIKPLQVNFGTLFQLPTTIGFLALLRMERGALPVDNLRSDFLSRAHLLDATLLNSALASLECLPSLSFAGSKVAEMTASRLDYIRNELREMAALSGDTPVRSEEVLGLMRAERKIVWLRLLVFIRFLTEALLVREDVLGLEFVQKVLHLVRCEVPDPHRARVGIGGMETRARKISEPWRGDVTDSALMGHPTTALHSLSSYFLYFCDRRVLSSFEGLAREQAAVSKLVYRMSKDPVSFSGGVAAAEESSSRVRAERTATTMQGAIALAQMFDAFYQWSFDHETKNSAPSPSASTTNLSSGDATSPAVSHVSPTADVWPLASHASLANPYVNHFSSGSLYLRALEIADVNLVAKVNELRRREGAKQRGVVPLAFLSILERTANQSAMLMAAAAASNHAPTSLHMSNSNHDAGSSSHLTSSSLLSHAGALNSSSIFGFTLFSLSLRSSDHTVLLDLLRSQAENDLFMELVQRERRKVEQLQREEAERGQPGGYAQDSKYASILQATRLLISEIQDTSYEMNVIKEWLASSGIHSSSASVASSTESSITAAGGTKTKVYYVLHKAEFNRELSHLLREVMKFGETPRAFRLQTVDHLNTFLRDLVEEKEALLSTLEADVTRQVEEYTAQSLAQVTDAQFQLITSLQSMKEQCTHLHAHAANQEPSIRTEIESQYEAKVHKLTMQILSLNSKLDINNISIRQRILTHYYTLKQHTLEAMIKNGSAPFLIKKRALKILSSEAAFQETKTEYYALHSTYLKMSTLFDMKDILQQRVFAKEQREIADWLEQHEALLQEIQACEQRMVVWTHSLQETKNSLMLCHKYLEELQKSFLHYRKENAKLNHWKRGQLVKLARLEVINRKFEDVSELDFDRLEQDLRQKAEEMLTAVQYEQNADLRMKLLQAAQEKKLKQVRRMIQREVRLITEAKKKIEESVPTRTHERNALCLASYDTHADVVFWFLIVSG
jgi:hypothetical protein